MRESNAEHKDMAPVLIGMGVFLLLVGAIAALYGPAETYCFYLFSEGGRFHYDGFGFGSFIFAGIAWQIIGYYLIALLLIPLGYGHLRLRRWARLITISLLWCAWVVGAPLIVILLSMLSVKELSATSTVIVAVLLGLAYLILPGSLIRFYNSPSVRKTFEGRDTHSYQIERLPMRVLVLAVLLVFYAFAMHAPLFFNGIFPLFGVWLSGIRGIIAIDLAIISLCVLMWGTLRQRIWAWWSTLAYFGLLTSSLAITLARTSYPEMLSLMRFPPTEMRLMEGVPLHGVHFLPIAGIPLFLTLCAIIASKRCFGGQAAEGA